MLDANKISQLNDLLPKATSILLVLTSGATLDQTASALALADSLRNAGKEVMMVTPSPEEVQTHHTLVNKDGVQDSLGNRDLTIGFEYQPEAVDKVSYHIDEDNHKFFLVIKPQKGQKPLKPDSVQFSYTGAEADMIFMIGVHEFESLGHLYFGYEQLYQDTTTVIFHNFEPSIGNIKLDGSGSSCLSEAMFSLIQTLNLPLSADAATNLLSAIEEATNHFQSFTATAETFATISQLMSAGGRRMAKSNNHASFSQAFAQGTTGVKGATPTEVPVQKSKIKEAHAAVTPAATAKKNKNSKNVSEAGDLHYQPAESSVGSGG